MDRPDLVGDTLLLGPTGLVDDMKDNATRISTLEVQIRLWKLNHDALRMQTDTIRDLEVY